MKKYTNRGFRNYADAKDSYGINYVIRESSAAMKRCVWLFIHDHAHYKKDEVTGYDLSPALHLTESQAKRVIKALQKFINEE